MDRKPRSDAKLLNLPEEDQRTIFDLLRHGVSYAKAKPIIKEKFSVKTSDAALSSFWEHWIRRDSQERIFKTASAADEIIAAMSGDIGKLTEASKIALQQATFETIYSGGDPKTIKAFSNILLKARSLEIDERKVSLLEQKARMAEEAESVTKDKTLTPEQRDQRMKEIFGF